MRGRNIDLKIPKFNSLGHLLNSIRFILEIGQIIVLIDQKL